MKIDIHSGYTVKTNRRRAKAGIERLENRLLLAVHTWTGAGGNGNWSNAANWTGGAPAAAESNVTLDFPAGIANSATNDDVAGLTLQSISFEGIYTVGGQAISTNGSIASSGIGSAIITNNITLTGDTTLHLSGQLNLAGNISGSFNLHQLSGTLFISGANTYTGVTEVDAGTLDVGSSQALGSTSTVVVASGASIMVDSGLTINAPLALSGRLYGQVGNGFSIPNVDWAGPITLINGGTIGGAPAGYQGPNDPGTMIEIDGNIGGIGDLTIDNGLVFPRGSNTYAGNTDVTGGILLLNDNSNLGISPAGDLNITGSGIVHVQVSDQVPSASHVNIDTGATLQLDQGVTDTVAGISGAGSIAGAGTLVDTLSANNQFFTGTIDGNTSLTLDGNATLYYTGTSVGSTTGTITLNNGAGLLLDASLPNATLDIESGSVYGSGTLGSLTAPSGDIWPGDSGPATLHFTGNLSAGAGSFFIFQASAANTYNTLDVGGNVTLSGNMDFWGPIGGYAPTAGTVFTIINNRGSQPVSGTFQGMPEGSIAVHNNQQWQISYVGGDGNDVTLTDLGYPSAITATTIAAVAPFGSAVFHATVTTSVSGAPTPTGTVTFKNGLTTLGIATLDANGVATFDATGLPVGSYGNVTATYGGDSAFEVSTTSASFSQTVTQASGTVALTPSAASAAPGAPLTLSAAVTGVRGAPAATGNVVFLANGTPIGTIALDGAGHASLTTSALPVGQDLITASYAGDGNYAAGSTPAPVTVAIPPGVQFSGVTIVKQSAGETMASFDVTLAEASNVQVTVQYTTQDGTALAGRDYAAASGTVTFAPGETSKTVDVPVMGGADWQPDRAFTLVGSSAVNATLATPFSTATIQSADGMPAAGLIPDELDPTQNDLVVYAPAGNDVIQLKTTRVAGQVQVVINRKTVAIDSGIDRVIVYGGTGNNNLIVNPRIGAGVIFFGGAGRNIATGGGGNDILVGGGGGQNILAGGGGMNLLIGGAGNANLHGSAAGDVLVGGATEYDAGSLSDVLSLESLLATWTAGGAYTDRAAALAASNGPAGATLDDATVVLKPKDHVIGRKNHDLVLAAVVTKSAHAGNRR